MKRIIFIYCLLLLSFLFHNENLNAQTYWMQKAGGINTDEGNDISSDAIGNSYTTGYFFNSAAFGSTTLNSAGVTDIFISKNDVLGNFAWSVKAGGSGADRGLSIKTDNIGNSYVTGYYYGTATFGSATITSTGGQDIFIAKYDNTGALQWVKSAGGTLSDIGNAINIDNSGNVIITGEFTGTSSFGSFSLTSLAGTIDVFTAKLDNSGNFLWAKKGSADATDRGIDVACDPAGNIYVTGQFSDTITFDLVHNNTIYNAIFLIKYDALGNEQWFQKIGGGIMNIVSGIVVDASSKIYITGDFTGNLIFFGPPSVTLTNIYSNKIFVACYDSSGNLLWDEADGSSGSITSKNIAIDNSGNLFIIGNFKCRLNEYADQYGQGIFNSVGYEDIFVTKYNSSGTWQWSRQAAGKQNDYGKGITTNPAGQTIITGSFNQAIGFSGSYGTFVGYDSIEIWWGGLYCGDSDYGHILGLSSTGSSDILIAKSIDPTQEPFDYYWRYGLSGCSKDELGVCISYSSTFTCPDTIIFCGTNFIAAENFITDAGPDYTYLWSTGETDAGISVSSTGDYWVQQTSVDGCFVSFDTVYVIINPIPNIPTITDDQGVNINAINTVTVQVCNDSVLLTGGNYLPNSCMWVSENSFTTDTVIGPVITADTSGIYVFIVTNNFGCVSTNYVIVIIDSLLPAFVPEMYCIQDTLNNDSISICEGEGFTMYLYDTISNPLGSLVCIPDLTIQWSVTPGTIGYTTPTSCIVGFDFTMNYFYPTSSGLYTINAMLIRQNSCDTDTTFISRDIYVTIDPNPIISITGNTLLCPGDSSLLIVSGAIDYYWYSWSTVFESYNDSVYVSQMDTYLVMGTNAYGCSGYSMINVNLKPQPIVSPDNALICPTDSVQLFCTGSGIFEWYGPSGILSSTTSSVFATTSGYYYCVTTDADSCELISNTVYVTEYTTPFLLTTPSNILCIGDSVQINVITNAGSLIVWQSPLSGSDTVQIITSPGVYSCTITSCGISTTASVTVTSTTVTSIITSGGPLTFCDGDSILLSGNIGMNSYLWQPSGSGQPSIYVYQSGAYTLTTSDINGCTAVSSATNINVTPNNIVPPISIDTSICAENFATLTASATGTIFWYSVPSGGTIIDSGNVFITPALFSTTTYYVMAADSGCKSPRIPVTVTIDECGEIIIPNMFTPNEDGTNDIFNFNIKDATCFNCKIYNRWGILIYEWDDFNQGWNGRIENNNTLANDGVYYFILEYCDSQRIQKNETGFLQLLRNNPQ